MRERHFFKSHELEGDGLAEVGEKIRERFQPVLIEGEKEKSPEQKKLISCVITYIKAEMERIGVQSDVEISEQSIHFLDGQTFQKHFANKTLGAGAFYDASNDQIFIDKNRLDPLSLSITLTHEILHKISPTLINLEFVPRPDDIPKIRPRIIKQGLELTNLGNKNESEHVHFQGFNELITDVMSRKIIYDNVLDLIQQIRITKEDLGDNKKYSENSTYVYYQKIVAFVSEFYRCIFRVSEITHPIRICVHIGCVESWVTAA